jgi:ribosomal protein S3
MSVHEQEALQFLESTISRETEKLLMSLGITNCEYNEADNTVTITLHRPGVLIGERGKNLEAITNRLHVVLNPGIKIKIIEDGLFSHLFAYQRLYDNVDY